MCPTYFSLYMILTYSKLNLCFQMEYEDGIPRSQPLSRTQSAQQMNKLVRISPAIPDQQPIPNYLISRSCEDLNGNKQKSSIDLAVPTCNSTMKIIDQMENLKFEQFDPILTSMHKEMIKEQVSRMKENFHGKRRLH